MDESTNSGLSGGSGESTGGTGASVTPHEQGAALMKMGRFPEAAAALRRAVEMNPGDEASWRLLGGALASNGDSAGAVEAFRRAVDLIPTSAKNHYNLGLAYNATGDLYQAKTHLERALALDPQYEQARLRLDELAGHADLMGSGAAAGMATSQTTPSTQAEESPFERTMVMEAMSPAETVSGGLGSIGSGNAGTAPSGGTGIYGVSENNSGGAGLNTVGGGASAYNAPPAAGGGTPPPAEPTIMGGGGGYAPTPVMGMGYGEAVNTSGTKAEVPAELQGGWNWGAFLLNWIWLCNHGMVAWGIGLLIFSFIPYLGILSLGASIYLGVIGNRLGWQNRRFNSIEDFKACQRIWALWGAGVFVVSLILSFVFAGMIMAMLGLAAASGAGRPGSGGGF